MRVMLGFLSVDIACIVLSKSWLGLAPASRTVFCSSGLRFISMRLAHNKTLEVLLLAWRRMQHQPGLQLLVHVGKHFGRAQSLLI